MTSELRIHWITSIYAEHMGSRWLLHSKRDRAVVVGIFVVLILIALAAPPPDPFDFILTAVAAIVMIWLGACEIIRDVRRARAAEQPPPPQGRPLDSES